MDQKRKTWAKMKKARHGAGLEVWWLERGEVQSATQVAQESSGTALGGPSAGAFARSGGPGAGTVGAGHAAGARRGPRAATDRDVHGAVRLHLAGNIEEGGAGVGDRPVLHLDPLAVGAAA